MRLINVSRLSFEEFVGDDLPRYAILSHRWRSVEDEVSYKDFCKGRKTNTSGYDKILQFCARAQADGLTHVWVDTSCIDKRSSAELSEAINSMFAWYHRATRCYAYLHDVASGGHWQQSGWWKRGWTLQELIAPVEVVFFDRSWGRIGRRSAMFEEIGRITGIPPVVLSTPGLYRHWTVAQKMSWAAGRSTSRVEDRAYSLLGLLSINMPLLYGEGEKAFIRLQCEVMQKFDDESIFAWMPPTSIPEGMPHLAFASSPDEFAACVGMSPSSSVSNSGTNVSVQRRAPSRVTSWGVELTTRAQKLNLHQPVRFGGRIIRHLWAITLNTVWGGSIRELPCTITLAQSGPGDNRFQRVHCFHGPSNRLFQTWTDYCTTGEFVNERTFYLEYDKDFYMPAITN